MPIWTLTLSEWSNQVVTRIREYAGSVVRTPCQPMKMNHKRLGQQIGENVYSHLSSTLWTKLDAKCPEYNLRAGLSTPLNLDRQSVFLQESGPAYIATAIKRQVCICWLAEIFGTVREPFDVLASSSPQWRGRAHHKKLPKGSVNSCEIQNVYWHHVAHNLRG